MAIGQHPLHAIDADALLPATGDGGAPRQRWLPLAIGVELSHGLNIPDARGNPNVPTVRWHVRNVQDQPRRTADNGVMENDRLIRPGQDDYDRLRSGFNTALEHRPIAIVDAAATSDVVAAVRLAGDSGRPITVMNTGHGPSASAGDAVMIRTHRMRRVVVDPMRRVARIEAGATWRDVIDAATPHRLAPLNGSSPAVGAVGYTLGGGVGHLARRFGFAADHVPWLEGVTADGRVRQITADTDPDLFWAMRGAGANFAVVTAMEIELFPVTTLLGGELCFGPDASDDVLHAYAEWSHDLPETIASSILLLEYPHDAALPHELRGTHVTHVRIADSSDDHARGARLADHLRAHRSTARRHGAADAVCGRRHDPSRAHRRTGPGVRPEHLARRLRPRRGEPAVQTRREDLRSPLPRRATRMGRRSRPSSCRAERRRAPRRSVLAGRDQRPDDRTPGPSRTNFSTRSNPGRLG